MPKPFPALTRLAVATALTTLVVLGAALATPSMARAQNAWDEEFLTRINAVRAEHGSAPLAFDRRAQRWAERWTARQIEARELSHQNLGPFVRGPVIRVGENVGANSESVAAMFQGFMQSPTHRANIVDPEFTHVGISTDRAPFRGLPAFWTTHIFIRAVDRR